MKKTTHFGYQEIPVEEKNRRVEAVFDAVANKYDLMNDFMSFGLHRLWKKYFLNRSGVKAGDAVLDVASGTGDLGIELAKRVGMKGEVVLTDINSNMLKVGRDKFINHNLFHTVNWVQANAENLPFKKNSFDCITIAFGLRNVTHKATALQSMFQILKPGGKLLILEFSKVHPMLNKIYDFYSFNIIPKMGEWIVNDRHSYQYLVESIRMHPNQKQLAHMMELANFEDVSYENLSRGIVAIHKGYKY